MPPDTLPVPVPPLAATHADPTADAVARHRVHTEPGAIESG